MSNDEDQRTPIFESALLMNGTSVLGLKSHWESEFAEDLRQLLDDKKIDSEGEELQFNGDDERELGGHCWFGVDVARRMVEFISPYCNNNDFTICDMGTGNGDVIFRLAEILANEKIFPQFIGVDYCKDSIRVCECLAPSRLVDGVRVKWIVDDAFDMKHVEKRSIDILLDKGMLDAVSMNGSVDLVVAYVKSLSALGKPGSTLLCITSGNFTVDELDDVMRRGDWTYHSHVTDYPTFQYGGVIGTHVRTVIYLLSP